MPPSTSQKRKTESNSKASRKKAKLQASSVVDNLPWTTISHLKTAGNLDNDDGILELEELDNVQVVYENTVDGRVAKFNVLETQKLDKPQSKPEGENSEPETTQIAQEDSFDSINLLPNWHNYKLHTQLLRSLHSQNFLNPTPIQSNAIPLAMNKRDVIGVAETGSGKTLAYGLPILHRLLSEAKPGSKSRRRLRALILAPTRELALQVSSHLNACLNALQMKEENEETVEDKLVPALKTPKPPPLVSVAAVVGGLSAQKQRRILSRGVDVLVATPGRLWDIMQEDDTLSSDIKELNFLVLDEADRMVESGHYAELDNILRLTLREQREEQEDFGPKDKEEEPETDDKKEIMQTFVFSATLSKDLQRNLKKRNKPRKSKKGGPPPSTLDDLVMRLDFRDPEPEVIDLSPEGGVVSSLQQSQVECLSADKDTYLYYFLLRYPGRSLVFLSSIDGIRRLTPLLELLDIKTFPLHSQLEQKQRLKNLDRFKSSDNSVLLATDIAARGLDIPSVDHVIHYQIPRSADVYVHRNGRTARAMRSGFSLIMCAPDERKVIKALLNSLGRKESDIPDMSIDLYMLDKLKARVTLARQIDNAQHKIKKANYDRNWLKETAEAMEIELDSDFASETDDRAPPGPTKRERKNANNKTTALKLELKQMLSQPLISQGISTRYITSGSKSIADELLAGKSHDTMLGMSKTGAGSDMAPIRKKKKPVVAKQPDAEYDKWDGFKSES